MTRTGIQNGAGAQRLPDFQEAIVASTDKPSASQHHEIFQRFRCWQGTVPAGFQANFLGIVTRCSFFTKMREEPAERFEKTDYPNFDEEYFEWIDLLEAVSTAKQQFTMIELGAGWGRWIANAVAALKQCNDIPYALMAVEAEPTHFQWLIEHVRMNGVDLNRCRLIEAAVTCNDGKVGFVTGEDAPGGPSNYYGQSIGGPTEVDAISLNTMLRPLKEVDLIDLDVQGAEFEVLETAAQQVDEKVRRVHIGTHGSRVESAVRSLFARLGWRNLYSYPGGSSSDTEWGRISFQDGVQSWINPKFCSSDEAVLKEKLESARREAARLWAQLDQAWAERNETGAERDQARAELKAMQETPGWRLLTKFRSMRDRLAPVGTGRRKLYEIVSSNFPGGRVV